MGYVLCRGALRAPGEHAMPGEMLRLLFQCTDFFFLNT